MKNERSDQILNAFGRMIHLGFSWKDFSSRIIGFVICITALKNQ